eukprot:snap_masked-scaffold_11-processed-gene-3.13-mRNA-1 protein AED:0.39 eAED:0.39 QI:0/0/0/0.5/1/1/2/0/443
METSYWPTRLKSRTFSAIPRFGKFVTLKGKKKIGTQRSGTIKTGGEVEPTYRNEKFLADGGTSKVYAAFCVKRQMDVALKKIEVDKEADVFGLSGVQKEAKNPMFKTRSRFFTFFGTNSFPGQQEESSNHDKKEDDIQKRTLKDIKKEIRLWKKAGKSRFILDFFEEQIVHEGAKKECWISMELAEKGNLFFFVQEFQDEHMIPLTFDITRDLLGGVLAGLKQIHCNQVIHKDIKPENILLTKNLTPKIADFGLAQKSSQKLFHAYGFDGTPSYAPPEAFFFSEYDESWDTFSFFLTLVFAKFGKPCWEINSFGKSFEDKDIGDFLVKECNQEFREGELSKKETTEKLLKKMNLMKPKFSSDEDPFGWCEKRIEFTQLAEKCLAFDFKERISCAELCEDEEWGWKQAVSSWESDPESMASSIEQKIKDWIEDDDMFQEDKCEG